MTQLPLCDLWLRAERETLGYQGARRTQIREATPAAKKEALDAEVGAAIPFGV